jgi:soluble lytic murein transglycosylase-like protein
MSLESVVGRIAELTAPSPSAPVFTAARPQPAQAPSGGLDFQKVLATTVDAQTAGPKRYDAEIGAAASKYGVDPALVRALIAQESGFDPTATSPAGAQGLMQLMPATARGFGVTDPYDPAQSIDAGTRYLGGQLDRFGGDVRLALAAYNAGPGAVERFGGVPPYAETQRYVENVLAHYQEGA